MLNENALLYDNTVYSDKITCWLKRVQRFTLQSRIFDVYGGSYR